MFIEWILLAVLALLGESKASTHFKFMNNYCSDTIEVQDSLVVVLVPSTLLRPDRTLDFIQCSLDLLAPEDHGIHVHFLHVSISPDGKHSDRLHLYEVDGKNHRNSLTPDQGLYGMLDRSVLTSDYDGAKIEDYTTWERRLRLDYLGKPTQVHSGFRVLITAVSKPWSDDECSLETSKCPVHSFCISSDLVCDGYPNCGNQDLADEKGCDPDHMVTDLLDKYSLVYDIVVVTCLPALIFLIIVILTLCLTWRHLKKKYPLKEKQVPTVSFNNEDGGRVEVYHDSYDPPSYNEAIRLNRPPAYSSLEAMEQAGKVVIESDDDHKHRKPRGRGHRHGDRRVRGDRRGPPSASNSSLDSVSSLEHHRAHPMVRGSRPLAPHYDSSDDEETKRKQRRKGGKCKGKRRADDLCPNTEMPQSSSHPEMPLMSSASNVSSPTVPYVSFVSTPLSVSSSTSSVPVSSPTPPLDMKHSPSTESESTQVTDGDKVTKSSSSSPDIAVLPVCNGAKVKSCSPEDSFHSESSGVEADRKSDTGSGSWSQSKNDSKTESWSSLSENKASQALMHERLNGDAVLKDIPKTGHRSREDARDNGSPLNLHRSPKCRPSQGHKIQSKKGKGNNFEKSADDNISEEDRTIDDIYVDLRSKETVTLKMK